MKMTGLRIKVHADINTFGDTHGNESKFGKAVAEFETATYNQVLKLPNAVDWRKDGTVTEVKFQGNCNSCYAFAATGALEGQHFIKKRKLVSLSEQNIVDCTNNENYHNQGCDGGQVDAAYMYVMINKGIDTQDSYPYTETVGTCKFKKANVGATARKYKVLPSGNEKSLQKAVAVIGPIAVGIDAEHDAFKFYSKGVYNNDQCSSVNITHAMLVVGYGVDIASETDLKQPYWIVKNSWGTKWGEDGYIRMARNKDNQCGIATYANYPVA